MQSTYNYLGLPDALGTGAVVLALIFALAPYTAGSDFGILKVPTFSEGAQKRLKIAGPILLAMALALFLPLWAKTSGTKEDASSAKTRR